MLNIRSILLKIARLAGLTAIKFAPLVRPGFATAVAVKVYGRWGMKFIGQPNYLSARINFDGTDYGLIEIHEGVTISSYVRVLTHDWSLYTVAKSVGFFSDRAIGKITGVSIGPYSFVGTGSIIMPGTRIGRGCLIGAGTVVRGKVPDYSIVVGSPGRIVGDTRSFIAGQMSRLGLELPADLAAPTMGTPFDIIAIGEDRS